MPELPEVETVKRVLEPQLRARRITALTAARPNVLARPALPEFRRGSEGAVIQELGRRGKFLQIYLDNGTVIILHLRMTGHLVCVPADFPVKAHTHVTFGLDSGSELRFIDVRRFGRFWLKRAGEEDDFSGMDKLGLEPFDEGFDADYLERKLSGRRITVKQGLLDQTVLAGIGNIYSDEVLFSTKIDPRRPVPELQKNEWRKLAEAIPRVLELAIEGNAVTPEEYLECEEGEYKHNDFYVYGREKEICRLCGEPIKRVKIAGRSSFYCPRCQR